MRDDEFMRQHFRCKFPVYFDNCKISFLDLIDNQLWKFVV